MIVDRCDVLIIGAGITGAAIAYYLSRYELKLEIVERMRDVADGGPTKANSAIIHSGYDPHPGTLKARLNVRGNRLWYEWVKLLDIPFISTGSLTLAITEDEEPVVRELLKRAEANGVEAELWDRSRILEREPYVNPDVRLGLWAPTACVIHPMRAVIAMVEVAKRYGASVRLNTRVVGLKSDGDSIVVETTGGEFRAKVVINAAGLYADEIMKMAGEDVLTIKPRKGEYLIVDDDAPIRVGTVLFPVPSAVSKGVLVVPTVGGEVLLGPTSYEVEDKEDVSTTLDGMRYVLTGAKKLVPFDFERWIFASFAGNRPSTGGDFWIRHSTTVRGLVNVAGIDSPGLASAPAIAEMVGDMVGELVELVPRRDWDPTYRFPPTLRYLPLEKRNKLISKNPLYGRVVCRCRRVSEGEIRDFIRYTGATTVDAVKRRLGVTGGHCGGTYCLPKIIEILADELGVPPADVLKRSENGSRIVLGVKGDA